ncbi:MAG: hypothetical protein PHO66_05995 [Eubacteriales bacterium]|nr:hypothetical protein [Eubacteriales bacterium]
MVSMKALMARLTDASRPRWFDWAYVGILVALGLYCYSYGDIEITALHSYDLLSVIKDGKVLSFYQIVLDKALAGGYYADPNVIHAANYNLVIYLALSAWLFPVKLIGHLTQSMPSYLFLNLYAKHMVVLALLGSGYALYRVGKQFGLDAPRSKWASLLFLSSPAVLYGTCMFGQLDILSVFFTLWALHFYLEDKLGLFSLVMAAALCFKMFALFVFVPLLLLREKRIWHLLKYGVIGASALVFTRVLAGFDPGYAPTQSAMQGIYNFTGRLFNLGFPAAKGGTYAFVTCFALLCFACYFVKPDAEEKKYWAAFVPLAAYSFFFLYIEWHPQWLVILYPFVALCLLLVKNFKAAVVTDTMIGLGHVLMLFIQWPNNFTLEMVNSGILPALSGATLQVRAIGGWIKDLFPQAQVLSATVFMASLIAFVLLVGYSLFIGKKRSVPEDLSQLERGVIWARMSVLSCSIIFPSLILYFLRIA